MAKRRFFKTSIDNLDELFESSKEDQALLRELAQELQHRKRARAKTLADKIAARLRTLDAGDSVEAPTRGQRVFKRKKSDPGATEPGRAIPVLGDDSGVQPRNGVELQDRTAGPVGVTQGGIMEERAWPVESFRYTEDETTKPGPDSILAAWLTQEVLSPQALPDAPELETVGRTLVRLADFPEPWKERRFWKKTREHAVYWIVYLGALELAKAAESILRLYPDDAADERSDVRGNTTLAVIVLDSQARPVQDRAFLSSFAWGYGAVRAGRLRGLAAFPQAERAIKAKLMEHLVRQDDQGKVVPLTRGDIARAVDWLIAVLNVPEQQVSKPGLAVRVPLWGGYNEAPEPELLNSFFIGDLAQARSTFSAGDVGKALAAYLEASPVPQRQDVVRKRDIVAQTLAPIRMPLNRWPGPGRHPLVLMQQAAINHSVAELSVGGLVGINGPPGTGKTTLLRDIVAKVVLDRAIAMSRFDKPESAFTHLASMRVGQAYAHLYQLDESLFGHEIVVASSNNKAVENISREIPAASAVADDLEPTPRYFQSIADAVASGKQPLNDGATWGLAAAVLGNSANRSAFIQSFWWHEKRGMARYLKAIQGVEQTDDEGADTEGVLDVVAIEQPPRSEIEALERWRTARHSFLTRLKTVETLQNQAQACYEAVSQQRTAATHLDDVVRTLAMAEQSFVQASEYARQAKRDRIAAAASERQAREALETTDRLRPGFFARLFGARVYRAWRIEIKALLQNKSLAHNELIRAQNVESSAARAVEAARRNISKCEAEKQKADTALASILSTIEKFRPLFGKNFANEDFWAQDEDRRQLLSPWISNEFQAARDTLFVETFALHRAFIDAAAKPLRHNLRAALEVMKGRVLKEQQEPARRSLWASLFLVVPVVSTTFASTSRLFGALGREQLGWLLIDEAGQAMPQAAVGALLRAKRAIVIGDPLQIQPVVPMAPKLIRAIFREFGVDTERWAAPDMSAQTLADRMSWFGTDIITDDGDIWVGSPLRVHRRCKNPMFRISNHVAYNGLMVYGTPDGSSEIGRILGESLWIDVRGEATGKWCDAEGQAAVSLLRRLLGSGLDDPDIFFITPFRIVAQKLREMIRSDRSLSERLPGRAWEWTRERVGTVHTFQGKEADGVVIVLGAPSDASGGARRWAGHPPNLLNVAVTRAKQRLYVVGNRHAWKDAGVFRHLAQILPVAGRPKPDDNDPVPRQRPAERSQQAAKGEWNNGGGLVTCGCRKGPPGTGEGGGDGHAPAAREEAARSVAEPSWHGGVPGQSLGHRPRSRARGRTPIPQCSRALTRTGPIFAKTFSVRI